jgi:hypothetical protein
MIRADNLWKKYGHHDAFQGLSFSCSLSRRLFTLL